MQLTTMVFSFLRISRHKGILQKTDL
nr:unnamed protein product [Callosobruchus analis]